MKHGTANDIVTFALLGFALLWANLARLWGRKTMRAARQFHRDYAAGVAGGGKDKLDALVEATREWPPEANQPVPYLPVEVTDFDLWQNEMEDGQ